MVNRELIDYIRSVLNQGYSKDQIKEHLLNYNYPEDVIEAAFLELQSSYPSQTIQQPQQVEKKDVKKKIVKEEKPKVKKSNKIDTKKLKPVLFIALAVVIFVSVGVGIYFLFFSSGAASECPSMEIDKFSNNDISWICVYPDNSKLHFLVKNTGNTTINFFDVKITGTEGSYSYESEEVSVAEDEIFTKSVDIPQDKRDYGDVERVEIVPGYYNGENRRMCSSSKLIYEENINTC